MGAICISKEDEIAKYNRHSKRISNRVSIEQISINWRSFLQKLKNQLMLDKYDIKSLKFVQDKNNVIAMLISMLAADSEQSKQIASQTERFFNLKYRAKSFSNARSSTNKQGLRGKTSVQAAFKMASVINTPKNEDLSKASIPKSLLNQSLNKKKSSNQNANNSIKDLELSRVSSVKKLESELGTPCNDSCFNVQQNSRPYQNLIQKQEQNLLELQIQDLNQRLLICQQKIQELQKLNLQYQKKIKEHQKYKNRETKQIGLQFPQFEQKSLKQTNFSDLKHSPSVDSDEERNRNKSTLLILFRDSKIFPIKYTKNEIESNTLSNRIEIRNIFIKYYGQQKYNSNPIQQTNLIYQFDEKNPKRFYQYLLPYKCWIVIGKVNNDLYLGGFVKMNKEKTSQAFLFSMKNRQNSYILKSCKQIDNPIRKPQYINFGDSQLRIKTSTKNVYLNIGCLNYSFNQMNGNQPSIRDFSGQYDDTFEFMQYEIHEIIFQK